MKNKLGRFKSKINLDTISLIEIVSISFNSRNCPNLEDVKRNTSASGKAFLICCFIF